MKKQKKLYQICIIGYSAIGHAISIRSNDVYMHYPTDDEKQFFLEPYIDDCKGPAKWPRIIPKEGYRIDVIELNVVD